MLLPFIMLGGLLFVVLSTRKGPATPAVGHPAIGYGNIGRAVGGYGLATVHARHTETRPGARVRFELGAPYAVVARTGPLDADAIRRLVRVLSLGTYRGERISVQPGNTSSTLSLAFRAPRTEDVPIGQSLDWDLGDAKLRLVLERVSRLDGKAI